MRIHLVGARPGAIVGSEVVRKSKIFVITGDGCLSDDDRRFGSRMPAQAEQDRLPVS